MKRTGLEHFDTESIENDIENDVDSVNFITGNPEILKLTEKC